MHLSTFTPYFIWIGSVFFMVGIIQGYRWLEDRKRRRFPFTHKLLRSPGEQLRHQIEDGMFDFAAYMMLMPTVPLVLYAYYLQRSLETHREPNLPDLAVLLIAIAGLATYVIVKTIRLAARIRRLRLGYAAELAVGEELNQLMRDGCWVFHDFPAERFNIDHIVVTRSAVLCVETKAYRKPTTANSKADAKVIYDGQALYFPDRPDRPHRDFIDQAASQAQWLRGWLIESTGYEVPVLPVVALPGWFIERTAPGGVVVVNPRNPRSLLRISRHEGLPEPTLKGVVFQLGQKVRDVDMENSKLVGGSQSS